MDSLSTGPLAQLLDRLHAEAEETDRSHVEEIMAEVARVEAAGGSIADLAAGMIAEERADYRKTYQGRAANFLAISRDYGRFLYAIARARGAKRIVEFGTSMGISTIYLAAALRDNGGGRLIGSELEPAKVARARANLEAAGLADLVEIREGDALETLADPGGPVDLLLVDGAFALYLPVLKLIEPHLRPGAVVLGENAFEPEYQAHVRNPGNGYVSLPLPEADRGNEFSVRTL